MDRVNNRAAHLLSRTLTTAAGCMEYQGCVQSNGYSRATVNRVADYGHRHIYRLVNGEIPPGLDVRHTCDNRRCINPAHLVTGTRMENMQDAVARGRQAKGMRLPQTKITAFIEAEIVALAKANVKYADVAKLFGICPQHAGAIAIQNGVRRYGISK
jgi:hypothetical protein